MSTWETNVERVRSSYEEHYQIVVDKDADLVEKRIALSAAPIPWNIMELLMEKVRIVYAQSQLSQNIILPTQKAAPTVDLFFQMQGHSDIRRSGQASRSYRASQSNLIHTPAYEGELQLTGPKVTTLVIQFLPEFFQSYFDGRLKLIDQLSEGIEKGQLQSMSRQPINITPALQSCLFDLINCPYKGVVKRLYLEGKLLEIVALQIEECNNHSASDCTGIRSEDIDKLMAIREWLTLNFLQPLSLREIAREAGLNEFKLKKGFRELFQTTVFNYLADLRLSYGKNLLVDEKLSLIEVADRLGYSQSHHFARAFKKRFGYLPNTLKK